MLRSGSRVCTFCLLVLGLCVFFLLIRRPPRSTLFSLHDALPISERRGAERHGVLGVGRRGAGGRRRLRRRGRARGDRKSTRLNSSHLGISYAVFCLKKKKRSALTQTTSD